MDHLGDVRGVNRSRCRGHEACRLHRVEGAIRFHLLRERSAGDIFGREEGIATKEIGAEHANNMRVVQQCQRADLDQKTLERRVVAGAL